jgi:hypothetical protein
MVFLEQLLNKVPIFRKLSSITVSRGSSVIIVSGYGLDDRAIEFRSPAEAKGLFL